MLLTVTFGGLIVVIAVTESEFTPVGLAGLSSRRRRPGAGGLVLLKLPGAQPARFLMAGDRRPQRTLGISEILSIPTLLDYLP
jgi:hypothetical protein